MKSFYVKAGDVFQGKDTDTWINDNKSIYAFNYSSPYMYLLPEDVEEKAEYFSVITKTADDGTDNNVFISFLNPYCEQRISILRFGLKARIPGVCPFDLFCINSKTFGCPRSWPEFLIW